VKQAALEDALRAMGLTPAKEQLALLERYEGILEDRGVDLGLVAESDRKRIRTRHLLDSARAAVVAPPAGQAYDLGSGGGLPGIVVAILCPELQVLLVERRQRRAAFLEWASLELDLANAEVRASGIENLPPGTADVCFARALADLETSWELSRGLLRSGGRLVYFAGTGREVPAAIPHAGGVEVIARPAEELESVGSLVIISL
jgi:16S rRNA (guanine527-N7)-methyltransferase